MNFYKFFEFSIVNLIIRCKFCYNLSESIFFLKNGFIYLNGLKITNPLTQVNVGDLIQLSFSENYFNFFKVNTNNKLKSIFFLKHIIWKNKRFKDNFYKQKYNQVPDWIFKISNFYDDIPSFIEVDFSIMSFLVIYKKLNTQDINLNLFNFINFYMLRNYNWNYLT